jgi:serine/threonine protein kinase
MNVKICDFGLAAQLVNSQERKNSACGTPNYLAPEVFEKSVGYSFEVDIWAIGIIAFTMFYGRPPFESNEVKVL